MYILHPKKISMIKAIATETLETHFEEKKNMQMRNNFIQTIIACQMSKSAPF
jgi:hypothetical protein